MEPYYVIKTGSRGSSSSGESLISYARRTQPRRKMYRIGVRRRVPIRRQIPRGYPGPKGTRAELKAVDTAVSGVADTTGYRVLLNGIARGDDIGQRIGRQVTMKYLELNVSNSVTAATGVDQTQRFLVVLDRQANATTPAITDILVAVSPFSLTNLDNRNRFVILADKQYALNATAESGSKRTTRLRIPLRNSLETFNNGDAGTVADIMTNSIHLVSVGTEAAGNTAGTITGNARLRYTD